MLGAGVSAYLISFFLLASILADAPLAAYIAQISDFGRRAGPSPSLGIW